MRFIYKLLCFCIYWTLVFLSTGTLHLCITQSTHSWMKNNWSCFSGSEGSFSRVILREAGLAQHLSTVPMLITSPLIEDVKERKHQGVLPTKSKIHFLQNLKQHLLRVKWIFPTALLLDTVACIKEVETHISGVSCKLEKAFWWLWDPSGIFKSMEFSFLSVISNIFPPLLCILLLLSLKTIFLFLLYFALWEELFIRSLFWRGYAKYSKIHGNRLNKLMLSNDWHQIWCTYVIHTYANTHGGIALQMIWKLDMTLNHGADTDTHTWKGGVQQPHERMQKEGRSARNWPEGGGGGGHTAVARSRTPSVLKGSSTKKFSIA